MSNDHGCYYTFSFSMNLFLFLRKTNLYVKNWSFFAIFQKNNKTSPLFIWYSRVVLHLFSTYCNNFLTAYRLTYSTFLRTFLWNFLVLSGYIQGLSYFSAVLYILSYELLSYIKKRVPRLSWIKLCLKSGKSVYMIKVNPWTSTSFICH